MIYYVHSKLDMTNLRKEVRMGKAFSEEERAQVQESLRRIGLKLLAESGIKKVSIRELTSKAGIAQGGFYTFYKDKEDFIMDLMCLRVREKTEIMYQNRKKTRDDPEGFLVNLFYREGMHLKENKAFQNGESDTIAFWQKGAAEGNHQIEETYMFFLKRMIAYWEKNGWQIECDTEGLLGVGMAAGILFSNAELMGETYFADIYQTFCEAEVARFFHASRK